MPIYPPVSPLLSWFCSDPQHLKVSSCQPFSSASTTSSFPELLGLSLTRQDAPRAQPLHLCKAYPYVDGFPTPMKERPAPPTLEHGTQPPGPCLPHQPCLLYSLSSLQHSSILLEGHSVSYFHVLFMLSPLLRMLFLHFYTWLL